MRLLFVTGTGWLTVNHFGAGLPTLFTIVAAGAVLSAMITAIAVGGQLGLRLSVPAASTGDPETES
ncbi:MAG: hypothetical protein JO333_00220 [Verrucomicrobia bacterium]|nr:hypothetical protein [Verrucomicrobiota bacterium]